MLLDIYTGLEDYPECMTEEYLLNADLDTLRMLYVNLKRKQGRLYFSIKVRKGKVEIVYTDNTKFDYGIFNTALPPSLSNGTFLSEHSKYIKNGSINWSRIDSNLSRLTFVDIKSKKSIRKKELSIYVDEKGTFSSLTDSLGRLTRFSLVGEVIWNIVMHGAVDKHSAKVYSDLVKQIYTLNGTELTCTKKFYEEDIILIERWQEKCVQKGYKPVINIL